MGIFSSKISRCAFLFAAAHTLTVLHAKGAEDAKLHALYLMQQNQIEEAIQCYRDSYQVSGRQDFQILQQMSLLMLQRGIQSQDPQES